MIKIGMTLAERYEVLEKIGTGGMSDVYRAKDHKLNRFVAVKILKQEFSENKEFLQKFRSEAQSAAGLMHPNIVNVYDVGEESGSHYIVMELVEGITLKKYIEKKARLSVREAVSIAIQVAQGIEAAHNNHIIHRDIKPQNVIISMDGKVKVTDFGIAKAATSNTITSNVMGSVHYTSPEQVRGGFSDEKSDIYSLGITLFEMLTGRVPFNGETTVAVAIKHIQEPMPTPRDYVPEIPISLEKIVLKCTQKSPDRRYQSAPELIEDLKKSLISPDEDFVRLDEPSEGGVTKDISAQEIRRIRQQANRRDDFDAQMNSGQIRMEAEPEAGAEGEELPPEDDYYDEIPEGEEVYDEYGYPVEGEEVYPEMPVLEEVMPRRKKEQAGAKRKKGSKKKRPKRRPEEVPEEDVRPAQGKNGRPKAPDVPGNSRSNPRPPQNGRNRNSKNPPPRSRSAAGSSKRRRERYDDENDPRMELLTTVLIVIAALVVAFIFLSMVWEFVGRGSDPKGNTGTPTINVEGVTATPQGNPTSAPIPKGSVEVPSVSGKSKPEAISALESNGFVVEVFNENSTEVAKNDVIRQSPQAGEVTAIGTKVTIWVSMGKETIKVDMPDLRGKDETEALRLLSEAGLTAKRGESEYSDDYDEGKVCFQNYGAGEKISTDSEVEYRISKGHYHYNINYNVNAPADYAGGNAKVILKKESGEVLFETTTDSFPVPINITNTEVPRGILTIEYMIYESQEIMDEEGNVSVQQVQVPKTSEPQKIEFTRA